MKLIGVAGFARSGKDTIADYLVREHGYTRLAFADDMRDMLYAINPIVTYNDIDGFLRVKDFVDANGWDLAKVEYPEIRALLQRLGTDAGRKVLGDTIWTDALLAKARAIGGNIVIADVRFEDECEAVRVNGGKVIRVSRPGISSVNDHISDKRLPDAWVDYEIENGGSIEDLERKVSTLI